MKEKGMNRTEVVAALRASANWWQTEAEMISKDGLEPNKYSDHSSGYAAILRTLADRIERGSSEGWRFDDGDEPWIESHDSEYLNATKVLILDWSDDGPKGGGGV